MTAAIPVNLRNRTHGKYDVYRCGCRCHACKVAWSEYTFNLRRRRAAALEADPTLRTHGQRTTYTAWGCRCDDCVAANSRYCRAHRAKAAS